MAATATLARMGSELIQKSKTQLPRRQFLVRRGCCPILRSSNIFFATTALGRDPPAPIRPAVCCSVLLAHLRHGPAPNVTVFSSNRIFLRVVITAATEKYEPLPISGCRRRDELWKCDEKYLASAE